MRKKNKLFIFFVIVAFLVGSLPGLISIFIEGGSLGLIISKIYTLINQNLSYLCIIYALVVAGIIFIEGQNPDRIMLWLLVLIFLPVVGVLIYMVIGPDPSAYKRRKEYMKPEHPNTEDFIVTDIGEASLPIAKLLHSVDSSSITLRNRVQIITDGEKSFSTLFNIIENAKKYIHLQFFIIKNDDLGKKLHSILIKAAKRGVRVRVLYDAIGSWSLNRKYTDSLRDAGIKCYSFHPVSFARFRRKMNYRNHRKIVVADGQYAFTGGANIGDDYLGKGEMGFWRDTNIVISGEGVDNLNKIFIHDWCIRTEQNPKILYDEIKSLEEKRDYRSLPITPLQVVSSGHGSVWHSIKTGYFSMIARATSRVWIATPYFVPGETIINAMITTALAGIDVRLMIPQKIDHILVHWATQSQFERLLISGVRIFVYNKGFLHAKTILTDDTISSIGSCNMDIRSLEINFENQVFFYDKRLNNQAAIQYETDIKDCNEITLADWLKRPIWDKILEAFGKMYSAQL